MNKGTVISLCDYTGNMVRPWAEAGYCCICVDIRQERDAEIFESGGIVEYVEADLFDYLPPNVKYAAAFAAPECTNLAGSGAKHFASKGLIKLSRGIALVERCWKLCDWTGAPWMLENPVGVLSSYWRTPDYYFQPWNFGDLESKKTCLWTGGGFVMPEFQFLDKPANVKESVWKMGPSVDRGRKRSVTPPGFARAVFEANVLAGAHAEEKP